MNSNGFNLPTCIPASTSRVLSPVSACFAKSSFPFVSIDAFCSAAACELSGLFPGVHQHRQCMLIRVPSGSDPIARMRIASPGGPIRSASDPINRRIIRNIFVILYNIYCTVNPSPSVPRILPNTLYSWPPIGLRVVPSLDHLLLRAPMPAEPPDNELEPPPSPTRSVQPGLDDEPEDDSDGVVEKRPQRQHRGKLMGGRDGRCSVSGGIVRDATSFSRLLVALVVAGRNSPVDVLS